MEIHTTAIDGVMRVESNPLNDERGLFARTYDEATFRAAGLPIHWPQSNVSWNAKRGTLRGMHFQTTPKPEPKLVRCTQGRVFDVAVDLRPDSASFRHWVGVELAADRRNAIYIPPGCAHGFLTLEDGSELFYQMGDVYDAKLSGGVRWNDPAFAIDWPFQPTIISERDANLPDFA